MFKVLIIVCTILPYPRGEILNTKCYLVTDKWKPSIYGYPSKKQCSRRVSIITNSIRKNFDLLYLKKYYCQKTREFS